MWGGQERVGGGGSKSKLALASSPEYYLLQSAWVKSVRELLSFHLIFQFFAHGFFYIPTNHVLAQINPRSSLEHHDTSSCPAADAANVTRALAHTLVHIWCSFWNGDCNDNCSKVLHIPLSLQQQSEKARQIEYIILGLNDLQAAKAGEAKLDLLGPLHERSCQASWSTPHKQGKNSFAVRSVHGKLIEFHKVCGCTRKTFCLYFKSL